MTIVTAERLVRTLLAVVFALALAGCSDDSDPPSSETEPSASGSTPGSLPPTGVAPAGESTDRAEVVVGDSSYVFEMDALPGQCNDAGNLISGVFALDAAGEPVPVGDPSAAVSLSFVVTVPDWEAQNLQEPQIGIDDIEQGIRWQAGEVVTAGVAPGQSQLDEWTLGEGQASGTATFIDLTDVLAGGDAESVAGSFDISCTGTG